MDTPAEDALNFGLEPARLCSPEPPAPAKLRAQVDGVDSAGIWAEGMHWRPPNAARETGPPRPQGAGARRRRRCQGCVQVGRGMACTGRREEGRKTSAAETRCRWSCARPRRRPRGSYLWREGGLRNLRGGGGFSGLRRSWHRWRQGSREEAGPEWGPRRRPELRAGIRAGLTGVWRGGARQVRGESQGRRDRGAWWTAVSGVAQSQTRLKRLSSSSSSSILITQLPPSAKAKGSYRLHGPQTVNNDGLFKKACTDCHLETSLHGDEGRSMKIKPQSKEGENGVRVMEVLEGVRFCTLV